MMEIFINDEKVLSVDKLRIDHNQGEIGLFSLFTNRFSNFRATRIDPVEKVTKEREKPIVSNNIKQWSITKAKPLKKEAILADDFLKEEYTPVGTEESRAITFFQTHQKVFFG